MATPDPPTEHGHPRRESLEGGVSFNALLGGAVSLWQPRSGYRITVDSLLLAGWAAQGSRSRVRHLIDLGAGVGALSLVLGHWRPVEHATLVEREECLAALAERNASLAGLSCRVHRLDLVSERLVPELRHTADLVVVNPPFYEHLDARLARSRLAARARFGTLTPFIRAASDALARRGRAVFAYPASELPKLLQGATQQQLVAKRLRLVHPFADASARLALIELRRAKPGGLVIEPPLVEWSAPGTPTDELARFTAARGAGRR